MSTLEVRHARERNDKTNTGKHRGASKRTRGKQHAEQTDQLLRKMQRIRNGLPHVI